jgi:hypothetical protein
MNHIEQNCTQLLSALKSCAAALKTAFDEIADPTARQVIDRRLEAASAAITDFEQALAAQPAHVQEPVAQDAEQWGRRLNDASWAATKAWNTDLMGGPMPAAVFNNIKGLIRTAILSYLDGYTAAPAAQPAPEQELQRYSPDGEGGMELDSLGAYIKLQDVSVPPTQPVMQEPVAMEAVYETIIHWDEGGGKRSRRELARRIVDLYTTPPAAPAQSCYCERCEALAKELAALKAQPAPAPGYCKHCKQYTIEEPLTAAQPAVPQADESAFYYLQDTRSYVGNCPLWWGLNSSGYTTDLRKAQKYTLEEAMSQHRSRDSDLPWLCSEIDAIQRPTIDAQDMHKIRNSAEQRAAMLASAPEKGQP